jgi:hypothetical protein
MKSKREKICFQFIIFLIIDFKEFTRVDDCMKIISKYILGVSAEFGLHLRINKKPVLLSFQKYCWIVFVQR